MLGEVTLVWRDLKINYETRSMRRPLNQICSVDNMLHDNDGLMTGQVVESVGSSVPNI